jgi:molecular chaperone DnaK
MTQRASTVYGIDLGTTYSCIARIDEYGRPEVIKNQEGDHITPSVVFFDGDQRVVGKEAKHVAKMLPDRVVEMVKRRMGDADWRFRYEGEDYRAEEISAFILRKVAGDAEAVLGEPVTDVVITCPAYFGVNEREATARAGELAGLKVRAIVNEPTAAAIAYGAHQDEDKAVLVYDLGGGTFDITLIDIRAGEIRVIATGGVHRLGGRDWDTLVIGHLAEQWQTQTASDQNPLDDPETFQDLVERAEEAKKSLTARAQTQVPVAHDGLRKAVMLSRETFEDITAELLEHTIAYTRAMLKEAARKGCDRFDQILLVGGSTRMPQVAARLKAEFGLEPRQLDPDELVAKGAALYGQKLALDEEIKERIESLGYEDPEQAPAEQRDQAREAVAGELGLTPAGAQHLDELVITNVTSRSFGIESIAHDSDDLIVRNLIRINDPVPAEIRQQFGTQAAGQKTAEIRIMENLSPDAITGREDSAEIGLAVLELPPGLPEDATIEIAFRLDEQGRLHATAQEVSSGKTVTAEIQTTRVISPEELEEARERAGRLVVS